MARPLRTEFVTGSYFHVLGVGAFAGRVITDADEPAAPPTAVMSYRTWQQSYGSIPSLVGSTFVIEGQPITLIGIAPPGFFGDTLRSHPPDFWLPVAAGTAVRRPECADENQPVELAVRHRQAAAGRERRWTARAADAGAAALAAQRRPDSRGLSSADRSRHSAQIHPLAPAGGGVTSMKEDYGASLRILLAVCGTVLLIACANIANLLLARGTARRMQTAVRIALGASRNRLIRQQLTEAVLLSMIGGLLGIAVAYLRRAHHAGAGFPQRHIHAHQRGPFLAGAGLRVPALAADRCGVWRRAGVVRLALRSRRSAAWREPQHARASSLPQKMLVIGQAALSLVLLACAGLLTISLRNLEHQDFGFATTNRISVEINPPLASYTPERLDALYRRLKTDCCSYPMCKAPAWRSTAR